MRLTPLQRYRLRQFAGLCLVSGIVAARFAAAALLGLCALALGIALSPFVLAFVVLVAGLVAVFPASKKEAKG